MVSKYMDMGTGYMFICLGSGVTEVGTLQMQRETAEEGRLWSA